ncbi:TPA: 1-(5-phosphoribosyl)-5-[(5-phosphoribosylamino)methylideneamino]imidazole-4-carboxamide isomerase [Candidatus Bathyarchaeota archaeon]|nr:1-(5-phosphoribosyl)-5-[(5-phosphoribosylamino)methylideneamino]imidazole-4-carboxamide isomerase [Candidatus Bathyarchaeota archaeon]
MKVIPAIDLMNGKVVRLRRGEPDTAKVYDQWGSPVQVAMRWKSQGAKRLHIIDLDAAFSRGDNMAVIAEVSKATGVPIQIGGGIRTVNIIEQLANLGIDYVILGSLAFSKPEVIPTLQERFGYAKLIVALDNKDGKVMVDGWKTETTSILSEALERFASIGVRCFLITSIAKDGMLSGPDLETLRKACRYPGIDIIAAGGIGRVADLIALKEIGVDGVVVGKALYEGRFTLREALDAVEAE